MIRARADACRCADWFRISRLTTVRSGVGKARSRAVAFPPNMCSMARTLFGWTRGLGVLSIVLGVRTASAETDHTFQSWTAALLQGRTNRESPASLGWWLDVHARRGSSTTALLVRPGIGWYFDERLSVWAGYLLTPTFVEGGPDRVEHRPWQQLQFVAGWRDTTVLLRSRFEQRWVQGESGAGFRLRQLVRAQHAVAVTWALVLWDELFAGLNETDWGQPRNIDQNRLFAGVAWLPRPGIRLEPGYLQVLIPRPGSTVLVHALSVNLFGTW